MAPIISVYNFASYDLLTVRSIWNFAVPVFPGIIRSIELSESCYPLTVNGMTTFENGLCDVSRNYVSWKHSRNCFKTVVNKKPSKRIFEYLNFQKRVNFSTKTFDDASIITLFLHFGWPTITLYYNFYPLYFMIHWLPHRFGSRMMVG